MFVSVPSASGLPVPERTLAQVYYFDDHVEIDAGGVEYDLSMDKIQSVSIQTNVDWQTQFVSSAGGALLEPQLRGLSEQSWAAGSRRNRHSRRNPI